MKLHMLSIVGFGLINVAFWPMFIAIARRGGLHSSFESMGLALQAFRAPSGTLETLALWGGPPVLAVGVLLTFAGVMTMDAGESKSCRAACAERGFANGRMRGNPHVARPQDTKRQCWCYNGSGSSETWAEDGIDLPKGS